MNNETWANDLYYSTSIPSPSPSTEADTPSPQLSRFELSVATPDGLVRARRRTPLSDLKESPDGLLVVVPGYLVRRLQFNS
jgi:hypothetical protein